MSQIKISVPNGDHVALRAMAKALEEIAVARGAPGKESRDREVLYSVSIDTNQPGSSAARLRECANYLSPQLEVDALMCDAVEEAKQLSEQVKSWVPPTADSTGTPWDERIHSASKALNADGSWRLRRKPKDMTDDDWTMYVNDVKVEICESQRESEKDDIDPEHYAAETAEGMNDIPEPAVTPPGDDFHVDAGVVTEQQVAAIPAPPPPPVFATVQEVDEMLGLEPDYTFPQVMQFLTERHGRITSPDVDQIIADMGLSSIMDLNTQLEHTGPFIARVKAHLGE